MAERRTRSITEQLQDPAAEGGDRIGQAPPFTVSTLPPRIGFTRVAVQPPVSSYLTSNDVLVFHGQTSQTGVTVTLQGRFLTPDGRISYFSVPLVLPSDRTAATVVFTLGECFLLGCAVIGSAQFPRASVWVKLYMATGSVQSPGTVIETLFQGHVDGFFNPTWPSYIAEHDSTGKGNIRLIVGSDPAAGINFIETVPTNARWRLISLRCTLTTDATAANRVLRLVMDDGSSIFLEAEASATHTASLARAYTFAAFGQSQAPVIDRFHVAIPADIELREGYRMRSALLNSQVGDDINEIVYLVEEWLEP